MEPHQPYDKLATSSRADGELARELGRVRRLAELGDVALSVAAEIKNPLCGLVLLVEVLQSKADPNPADAGRRTLLDNIRHEAERMEKIVEDLLLFARHTTAAGHTEGDASIATSPQRLEHIVRRSIDEVQPALYRCGIRATLRYASADCEVAADGDLLQVLFSNILLRAAGGPSCGSGEIDVYVLSLDRDEACVAFRGDVEGIAASDIGGIFRSATRPASLQGDGRTEFRRSGLEAMVRKIIEAHEGRGEMKCESGKGSTYSIIFPQINQKHLPARVTSQARGVASAAVKAGFPAVKLSMSRR